MQWYHPTWGFRPSSATDWRRWHALARWLLVGMSGLLLGGGILLGSTSASRLGPLIPLVLAVPFVLMMTQDVKRFLLAVILLELPIQLDFYWNHRPEVEVLGALSGVNISLTTVCLLALYGLWLAEALAQRTAKANPLVGAALPLLAYLVFVMLSMTVARDRELAIFEVWLLIQGVLLFLYLAGRLRTPEDILFVITILLVGLVLQSLIMIGVRVLGESVRIASIDIRIDVRDHMRVGGTVGSPNNAAAYLTLWLAPALGMMWAPVARWRKLLSFTGLTLGVVALFLTGSRGGTAAFLVSFALLGFLLLRHRPIPPALYLVALGALLVAILWQDIIIAQLFREDRGAAYSRIPLMKIALAMIRDHPILGVGSNNSALMIPRYVTPEFRNEWIFVFHNKYLLVWAETGIGALLAFLWFLAAALYRGWWVWRQNHPLLSPLIMGVAAALAGQMFHMTVDIFNGRPQVQMLCVVTAIIAAAALIASREANAIVDDGLST